MAVILILGIYNACLLCIAVSYLAYKYGLKKGEAIGWRDGYFRRMADDREKRGPDGRFKERRAS